MLFHSVLFTFIRHADPIEHDAEPRCRQEARGVQSRLGGSDDTQDYCSSLIREYSIITKEYNDNIKNQHRLEAGTVGSSRVTGLVLPLLHDETAGRTGCAIALWSVGSHPIPPSGASPSDSSLKQRKGDRSMSDVIEDNEPTTDAGTVAMVCCNVVNGVICRTLKPTSSNEHHALAGREHCPACDATNWDMVVL